MANISKFFTFVMDSIDNLRSGISKNALMFASEFFGNKEVMKNPNFERTIIDFILTSMPSILGKTISEKAFIKIEARNSVENALDNCVFDDLLNILIANGCNANKKAL